MRAVSRPRHFAAESRAWNIRDGQVHPDYRLSLNLQLEEILHLHEELVVI